MLNKISPIALVGTVMLLTACQATTAPIIARADKSFETTGMGTSKLKAQEDALDNAKKHCAFKTPIIISDKVVYNGIINEKAGRMLDKGIDALGTILGTKTPDLSRDDDYEYHIKFYCQ